MEALADLRGVDCQRLTLGQYLRPSLAHMPVARYWSPEAFNELGATANDMGFEQVRSGPLVRSSYHAGEPSQSGSKGLGANALAMDS